MEIILYYINVLLMKGVGYMIVHYMAMGGVNW